MLNMLPLSFYVSGSALSYPVTSFMLYFCFWQLRQLRPVACKDVHSHDPVACKALKALKALQGSQGIEDTLHTSKRRRHGILTNL